MTGYTVHTGSSLKFSHGWDRIFEGQESGTAKVKSEPVKKIASAKSAKKSATKKSAAKTSKSPVPSSKKAAVKPAKKKAAAKGVKKGK